MDFRNILIFRIGHLGDTVVALPALWALRRRFPFARLSLLTNLDVRNPHYISPSSVLPSKGLLDEFIAYPTHESPSARAVAFIGLIRELRGQDFDAAIYLMPRVRTARQIGRDRILFRIFGIEDLLGCEFLLNNRLETRMPGASFRIESESDFLLRMLNEMGIESERSETDLRLTEGEVSAAKNWINISVNARAGLKLIAVGPGAKWESKTWSEDRFSDVVSELVRNYDCHPIVFGGSEDRGKGQRLLEGWDCGSNAAGTLSVREAAAVLQQCSLYLGNDTGTMHLAAAMGTPCIAVFANLDSPGRWDPFGKQNRLFRSSFNCSGCEPGNCVNQKQCLNLIGTKEVYTACSEVLESERKN